MNKITVVFSALSLFDGKDGHKIFQEKGQKAFDQYSIKKAKTPYKPGVAAPLAIKMMKINEMTGEELFRIVVVSRNSTAALPRFGHSVHHYGWDKHIRQAIFVQGGDRWKYVKAMGADLMCSTNAEDVIEAAKNGVCAVTLTPKETDLSLVGGDLKIGFDWDGTVASKEADDIYMREGLEAFQRFEISNAARPAEEGPIFRFLLKLHELQKFFDGKDCPVKTGIITARGISVYERVWKTLEHYGVKVDEAMLLDGSAKGGMAKAGSYDFLLDDVVKNVHSANEHDVMGGLVPGEGTGIVAAEPESAKVISMGSK